MHSGMSHIHKRKRAHVLSTYPHPTPWVALLDKFLVAVAVIAPLMSIPQIYKILSTKTAAGVSPVTWGMFALLDLPWIVYGIVHKERPILIAYICWFTVNFIVMTLAIYYG